jgi:predicted dehydrogenase
MKVKIIGAGSIGNHLSHAARCLGWSVDLIDCDPAALERAQSQIYPTRYGRWDEAIRLFTPDGAPESGYDLIGIGTPPDTHMELALRALEEKPKAILIEKPVCTPALEYANDLLSVGKARGCLLFVGYDHVVGTAANRFCELIDQNVMGKPLTLDVEFREHWAGILAAHPWLDGPADSYLGFWRRGGGAAGEHSHGLNLWQHFAHRLGLGRVKQVTATLDYVQDCGGDYDRLCLANLATEYGFVGRVVQDVLTRPARKWARLQGSNGFLEWVCGQEPGMDAVNFSDSTGDVIVEKFAKTRPEEFILELKHIAAVMKGDIRASDLAIERGLDTILVAAAAHLSSQEGKTVTIDWSKGYSTAALNR